MRAHSPATSSGLARQEHLVGRAGGRSPRSRGTGRTSPAARRGCRRRRPGRGPARRSGRPARSSRAGGRSRTSCGRRCTSLQRLLDLGLGGGVDRRGGVVEDRGSAGSARIARAIAIRWRWPPESVSPRSPIIVSYPFGQALDETGGLGGGGGALHLLAGGVAARVGDVVVHGGREQERVVGDDRHARAAGCPVRPSGRRRRRSRPSRWSRRRGAAAARPARTCPSPSRRRARPSGRRGRRGRRRESAGVMPPSNVRPTPREAT